MFWIKNEKIRYTPANPSFFYIKERFTGVYIIRTCFCDGDDEFCIFKSNRVKIRTVQMTFMFVHIWQNFF